MINSSSLVKNPDSLPVSVDLFTATTDYANAGHTVLPCYRVEKRPTLPSWGIYHTKPPTLAQVELWFKNSKVDAIGLVTGKGFEVLDFDAGGKCFEEFKKIVAETCPGLLEKLVVEKTPSGGFHVFFRCDIDIPGSMKLATEAVAVPGEGEHVVYGKKYKSRKYQNGYICPITTIETKGRGGLVLCAPTSGYEVIQGNIAEIPTITKEERDALIQAASSLNKWLEPSAVVDGHREEKTKTKSSDGLSPAEDFNMRGDIRGVLRNHGATELRNSLWRRPGKSHGQSASLLNDGNVFYCFSSNWPPFEEGRGYSKFAVYALLEHNGDYREAAIALMRLGYGCLRRDTSEDFACDSYADVTAVSDHTSTEEPPIDAMPILEFPDIMDGVAGQFADVYSEYLESPKHFFYIAFLTCLGNILCDRLSVDSELKVQARLYTLLLGASADDRKSTAIDKAVKFFRDALTHGQFAICYGVGSAEGLQLKLEDYNQLLMIFDEFKAFVGKAKIDASVLLPCVTTLFESNHYENKTKKSEICINYANLSILAASTIPTYQTCFDAAFTDIGFVNRLFIVPGSGVRRFSLPAKIPEEKIRNLRQEMSKVLAYVGNKGIELNITSEARELFHEWYMKLESSVHTKRLDTYAMRFMLLLAVNEMKSVIDADIGEKVIKLMDWELKARKLYDPIDTDGKIATMEEKIRRLLHRGPLTEREIKQHTNARRTGVWVFASALKNLENTQEIQFDKSTRRWFARKV